MVDRGGRLGLYDCTSTDSAFFKTLKSQKSPNFRFLRF